MLSGEIVCNSHWATEANDAYPYPQKAPSNRQKGRILRKKEDCGSAYDGYISTYKQNFFFFDVQEEKRQRSKRRAYVKPLI